MSLDLFHGNVKFGRINDDLSDANGRPRSQITWIVRAVG